MNIKLTYPNGRYALPKQLEFHQDKTSKAKILAGGFGSGKTSAIIVETWIHLFEYNKNVGVIGRVTVDELNRTVLQMLFDYTPSELIQSHNKNDRLITFINGSQLYYMPLDDARKAADKIKSMNLGFVAIDQLEEVSENIFEVFMGRLRRENSRRQFFASCNPEGHNWIWKKFINEQENAAHRRFTVYTINPYYEGAPEPTEEDLFERAEQLKKDPSELLIKDFPEFAQYSDNPYLPMDFLINMLKWPKEMKDRYVFGKWSAFEGLIYPEWNRDVHLIPPFETDPKKFVRVIAMDYGKRSPTAVGFFDIDSNGNVYLVDGIYQAEVDIPTLKMIIRAKNRNRPVRAWIADPAIFKEPIYGYSVARLFSTDQDVSGWSINWKAANNDIASGIDVVKQYLRHDEFTDGKPKFYVFEGRFPKFVEEIEDYRWKKLGDQEKPEKKNDHAMDMLRYALTYIRRFDIKAPADISRINRLIRQIRTGTSLKGIRPHMVM